MSRNEIPLIRAKKLVEEIKEKQSPRSEEEIKAVAVSAYYQKRLDTITSDSEVTKQDLIELLDNAMSIGLENAIEDFFNAEYEPIEDDELMVKE